MTSRADRTTKSRDGPRRTRRGGGGELQHLLSAEDAEGAENFEIPMSVKDAEGLENFEIPLSAEDAEGAENFEIPLSAEDAEGAENFEIPLSAEDAEGAENTFFRSAKSREGPRRTPSLSAKSFEGFLCPRRGAGGCGPEWVYGPGQAQGLTIPGRSGGLGALGARERERAPDWAGARFVWEG